MIKEVTKWGVVWMIALIVLATGCKKNVPLIKFNNNLQGTWSLDSNRMEYYDSSNMKQYEEELNVDDLPKTINFNEKLKASIYTKNNATFNSGYDIILESGIYYIELFSASIFNSSVWRFQSFSKTSMKWQGDYSNIQYEDEVSGSLNNAPNAVLTLYFSR